MKNTELPGNIFILEKKKQSDNLVQKFNQNDGICNFTNTSKTDKKL